MALIMEHRKIFDGRTTHRFQQWSRTSCGHRKYGQLISKIANTTSVFLIGFFFSAIWSFEHLQAPKRRSRTKGPLAELDWLLRQSENAPLPKEAEVGDIFRCTAVPFLKAMTIIEDLTTVEHLRVWFLNSLYDEHPNLEELECDARSQEYWGTRLKSKNHKDAMATLAQRA